MASDYPFVIFKLVWRRGRLTNIPPS